ncbi:MAG: hypothetical protein HYX27_16935 [Acidobacteria bacterium]|nr:hypothetical protein [Acidobacteriota bacterium]
MSIRPLRPNLFLLVILVIPSTYAQIQASPETTKETGLPPTFHCGEREDLSMTNRDKRCYWWTHSFNAPMVTGALFNAAMDQWVKNNTGKEWGQGVEGFSRRFGTRISQSLAKGSGQAIVGMIFKEDPRFYASYRRGFGKRLGYALSHTFIVRHDCDPEVTSVCSEQLSAGRLAGAFASGFVGMAWTPDRINTPQQALIRSGNAMAGVMAGSLWKEFQPDITRLFTAIVRRPPKKVTAPPSVKQEKAQQSRKRS